MLQMIDGKAISGQIKDEVKEQVARLKADGRNVCLAVVQVGDDPASSVYVRNKHRACEYTGIESLSYHLPEASSQEELLTLVEELNQNPKVNGILVQFPLPAHLDENEVIKAIHPAKDVDGFHPENVGGMFVGADSLVSCTPAGVLELLRRSDIPIEGKECVVVGRSNNVGKPMGILLMAENGTVTVAHSKTKNLKQITKRADILVAAMGKPKFITGEYVKDGAVIIDVGIHRLEGNKLCGDVDFEDVKDKAAAITPVPGGVGPMTVAMLMYNCLKAAVKQEVRGNNEV